MEVDHEGYVHVPIKPSIGIDLDEDWVQHHCSMVLRATP